MESEHLDRLQSILESLDDLVFVLDEEGVFIDMHHPKDGGVFPSRGAVLGRRYEEVLPAKSSVQLARALKAIEAGNRAQEFDCSMELGGRECWWNARVTRRVDALGRLIGATIVCREISERQGQDNRIHFLNSTLEPRLEKLTQPGVEVSSLGFRDIFDLEEIQKIQDAFAAATGVASLITDVDGLPITRPSNFCTLCEQIIRKTPKGRANCCYSDAVIGRMHPSGPIMQPCLSGGLFDGGTSIRVDRRHIGNWLIGQVRDGSVSDEKLMSYAREIGADEEAYREALSSVMVMSKDQFGKVCKALHLIGDQLSRLAYQNVQQARYIIERKQLETQLRQAQKLEAIGQLAGGIAHDFNNILTVQVLHFAMLEERTDLPSGVLASIQELHSSARSAAGLTQQLLAFSRRQILQTKVHDLNLLLKDLLKLLTRMLREDIALVFEPALQPALVKVDGVMMEQVFINLVVNARDAIRSNGQVSIRVTRDDARKLVSVSVADTGCGMDEEVLSHIFEPFFTTKDKGQGTGLGLATVYGIVKQHEGTIHVDSTLGSGTCFTLEFPLDAGIPFTKTTPVRATEEPAPQRTHCVLIVEDEANVREVVQSGLEYLGYRTFTAKDAQEACLLWARHREAIDLVVTDMVMPGEMNGLELARFLISSKAGLRVIIASGYSSEFVETGAPVEKCLHYLPKPYELEQLASLVKQLLQAGS